MNDILRKSLTRLTAATEGISDLTEGGTCLIYEICLMSNHNMPDIKYQIITCLISNAVIIIIIITVVLIIIIIIFI